MKSQRKHKKKRKNRSSDLKERYIGHTGIPIGVISVELFTYYIDDNGEKIIISDGGEFFVTDREMTDEDMAKEHAKLEEDWRRACEESKIPFGGVSICYGDL